MNPLVRAIWDRLWLPGLLILAVMTIGTLGYLHIGGPQTTAIYAFST